MARDPAAADLSVEARHRAASARVRVAKTLAMPSLHAVVKHAVLCCESRSLDSFEDRAHVVDKVLEHIRRTEEAAFIREILGPDPKEYTSRAVAHGALLQELCEAAMRLAGGPK